MDHQIKVNKYLSEKKQELLKLVDETIAENKKLHIGAPVGTGKTTFAIEVVEHLGTDYKVLLLFPIIAISEQAQVEFEKRNIDAEIFNSKVKIEDVKNSQVILSTIDSTHKLIDDGFLKDEKVLIILDETHTYLQNAREGFAPSVDAILNSGYPIIGLSATPSVWVNHFLFEIDEFVKVEVSSFKPNHINPVEVKSGLLKFIAGIIASDSDTKWIVFLERISYQRDLKDYIKEQWKSSKVVILNAETKKNTEKETWKHLMKKGELPNKIDVTIINSVAQSGINIKNKDIDHVIFVDKHDPFGIAQYLGRCRQYTGAFDFYFTPGGKYVKDEIDANYIQKRIKLLDAILDFKNEDYHEDLKSIITLMGGEFSIDSDGSLAANRCVVATKIYSQFRQASGERITNELARLFPEEITVNEISEEIGVTGSTALEKKKRREKARKGLIKLITKNTTLILGFAQYVNDRCSHEDALELVNNSTGNLFKALVTNIPMYRKVKDKRKLRKIIKKSVKADRSMQRIIAATTLYTESGKKKEVLRKYIMISNQSIEKLFAASHFFDHDLGKNQIISHAIEELEGMIGQVKKKEDWLSNIQTLLGTAQNISNLEVIIYNSCLLVKRKEVIDTAAREIHRELTGINKSFKDFLNNSETLKDFINPDG